MTPSNLPERLQQWAEGAKSNLETDSHGCPPVVVVNLDAYAVVRYALADKIYWGGIAIDFTRAIGLFETVSGLENCVFGLKAKANLRRLAGDLFEEPFRRERERVMFGGIAIVVLDGCFSSAEAADAERRKCHERGHVIQRIIGKGNIDAHAPMAGLYARPEARKFASRCSLYDPQNQASIVTELAMHIASGGWREYGFSADEATAWMTAYLAGVREMHGDAAVMSFWPVLRTRVAKAAFRSLEVREGGTA